MEMFKLSLLLLFLMTAGSSAYMRKKNNGTIVKNYSGGSMTAKSNGNDGTHSLPTGLQKIRNSANSTATEKVNNGSSRVQGVPNDCICIETWPADFAPATGDDGKNCTCPESLPTDFMSATKKAQTTGNGIGTATRANNNKI